MKKIKKIVKKKPPQDIKNDDLPKISFGDALKKIANAKPKNVKDG